MSISSFSTTVAFAPRPAVCSSTRRTAPSSFPRDAADSPNREVYENSRFLNAEKRSPLSPRNSLNSADGRPCPEVLTAFKQSGWGKIDVQSVLAMERREGKEEAAKSLVGVEKVLLEHGSDRENIVEDGAAVDAVSVHLSFPLDCACVLCACVACLLGKCNPFGTRLRENLVCRTHIMGGFSKEFPRTYTRD